jgi:hypothetical protein
MTQKDLEFLPEKFFSTRRNVTERDEQGTSKGPKEGPPHIQTSWSYGMANYCPRVLPHFLLFKGSPYSGKT